MTYERPLTLEAYTLYNKATLQYVQVRYLAIRARCGLRRRRPSGRVAVAGIGVAEKAEIPDADPALPLESAMESARRHDHEARKRLVYEG